MKSHAREYLQEYANTHHAQEWLVTLINEAITTNGAIPSERLNVIFDNFLNGNSLENSSIQYSSQQAISTHQTLSKLLLKSLRHTSGVCALSENQRIDFSNDVTVLYGLNGSGKSSYFRILNELCGGNQKKEILPNIYQNKEERKPICVDVNYQLGNEQKQLSWDNSERGLSDFQGIKVFDSSYLKGLLEARSPDSAVIHPLGLHLFKYIIGIIDNFSERLKQKETECKAQFPAISTEHFSDENKTLFTNTTLPTTKQISKIKELFQFSDNDLEQLKNKQHELQILYQTNYEDRINLLNRNITELNQFKTKVNSVKNELIQLSFELKAALQTHHLAKQKNDNARKQSDIINAIPQNGTEEWKSFIKAGMRYSASLTESSPKKCPYCHQILQTEESLRIIQAYTDYLTDKSEIELHNVESRISSAREAIKCLDTQIPFTDIIKDSLKEFDDVESKLLALTQFKNHLLIVNSSDEIELFNIDLTEELAEIDGVIESNKRELIELGISKEEKSKKSIDIQSKIAFLLEKQSIFEQKPKIEEYFKVCKEIQSIQNHKKDLLTRELTILSKTAEQELVTKSLEQRINDELKKLGKNNLTVHSKQLKSNKGNHSVELLLQGDYHLGQILSEGEQKAVGLAVFFAEIQDDKMPIILDDPTTSLDHKIVQKLAHRLTSFGNQVIIFSHYQRFVNAFKIIGKSHFCEINDVQNCKKQYKHIYVYEVCEDLCHKGIVYPYCDINAKKFIDKVDLEIRSISSNDLKDVPKNIRKCVECLVDEVILKNQLLRRFGSGEPIQWHILKKVNSDLSQEIDILHEIHGRVSGGEIHFGIESEENPITPDELGYFISEIKRIYHNN